MIPTVATADLSEDAKALLRSALNDYNPSTKVDEDQMAAATELAETGYATLTISENYGATLYAEPKAKGFSVAIDDTAAADAHLTYIEVEVLRSTTDRKGAVVAALYGATIGNRTSQSAPWPQWNARVHHATARDSDHSACVLADVVIDHPVLDSVDGTQTVLIGTLTDLRIWPTGTDITLIESNRKTPLDEPDMCTGCATPHPYGPYIAPERDDLDRYLNQPVRVTITPIALVDANGQKTTRERITKW